MKIMLPYLLVLCTFTSCIKEVDNASERYPQQWQLVRMTNQYGTTYKTGGHLEWQEFYLLNPDGTFLKSRLENGNRTSATGVFSIQETGDETTLTLSYDVPNEIIGSCSGDNQETLVYLSNSLLIGTWSACDGPGLEYFRVK